MSSVYKISKILLGALFMTFIVAAPAMAQTTANILNSRHIGAGLVILGAGFGIGKLASSALESMARQPEVAGSIQTAMIIAAALIEGVTLFALYICMSIAS
jgi:F-type H+-transporting ATPase subunit c